MKRFLLSLLLTAIVLPAAAQNHNFDVARNLDIFNALYKELDLSYVDTLDADKNIGNAILYMLHQLDPYTEFYKEDEAKDLKQLTTGRYAGIGSPIIYRKQDDRCIFSDPYEGMPAAKAGVRTGDVIMAIDGKDVGTCGEQQPGDYSSAVSEALRGEPGTTFELTVKRPGTEAPLTFKLTRETIQQPSVAYACVLSDSIGYVSLTGYTENTARELRLAVAGLRRDGARRLVLDLRGNPGGLLREAVTIVNFFVPKGLEVVRTQGKLKEQRYVYKTEEEPLDTHIPLVVLVDYATASAAEITSGALQDYDRAVIVGQRTYGKGLVQEPRELPYNTFMKLTTSKYFIPSGRCIQAYDFKNRNADGQPRHLPDSLCRLFHTAAGRPVRDGGGITPDVSVEPDSLPGLVAYLQMSDALFDWCVRYRNSHERIAAPDSFHLTEAELNDFKQYVKDSDFTYDRRSKSLLDLLRKVAADEGYAEDAKAELDALEKKLTHDIDDDLSRWQDEVRRVVESEIVANYYYDRGVAAYNLPYDKDLREAIAILRDDARYRSLLAAPKGEE